MPWVRLDDGMLENPKVAAAGPVGFALHVAAIIYCGRNLTDGFVPYGHARRLLAVDWTEGEGTETHGPRVLTLAAVSGMAGFDGDELIERIIPLLCELELWQVVNHGYLLHDYLEYNPSKVEVLALRAERQEAGRKGGQASAQAKAQASAQPKARANGQARPQAKSNPVPVPLPVGSLEPPIVPLPLDWVAVCEAWETIAGHQLSGKEREDVHRALADNSRLTASEMISHLNDFTEWWESQHIDRRPEFKNAMTWLKDKNSRAADAGRRPAERGGFVKAFGS